jgi:hypothetical protein
MSRTVLASAVALAATFLSPASPRAETPDDAIYVPGTACHAKRQSVSSVNYKDYWIENTGSSSAKVVCPLQFQEVTRNFGMTPADVQVFAVDPSSSSNISCTLFVFADGDPQPGQLFQETGSTSGKSSSFQLVAGQDGAFDVFGPSSQGWFNHTFTCTLPAINGSSTSRIVDFKVTLF